ncbi:MAG: hypothetical protein JO034_18860, partial [Singulisphaera sp.]|nr:hypothetical protein [Singulisphaera sp.]
RLSNADGACLWARRVTVELDRPTRDGDREIPILTSLPAGVADAITVAEIYRQRWALETGQADSTSSDRWCEAPGAGYHRRYRAA